MTPRSRDRRFQTESLPDFLQLAEERLWPQHPEPVPPSPDSLRPSPDDYLFSARGTLLMCPRPFGRGRLRPAGLFMPRARPCGRARLCSAPTTPCRRVGDSGPWCGAWCAASASDLRHASIIFPRAYPRDAVRERAEHGRCDGRTRIGRAAAGRDPGRRGRSDRGRRHHGRDRRARPFAGRRPFAFDPARTTLRACATRRGSLGRAHRRPDLPAARDRPLCRGMGAHAGARCRRALSALIAIETLRTLALRTMADLSQRTEPVPTEDLARLALALSRIESADRLRIEREQAMADPADAHAGAAARAARMTHAERVETVRRALEGHVFPGRTDPPPPAFGWAAASAEDSPVTLPKPAPDPPAAAPPANSRVTPPEPAPESPATIWRKDGTRRRYVTCAGRAIHGTWAGRGMPS